MKILVASSSRADYDLLHPIVLELNKVKKIKCEFLITGSHFSKLLSTKLNKNTDNKIVKKYLNILNKKKTNTELIFSNAIKKFSGYLNRNRPDILMVLGDRFEVFSLVICATFKKIPIAHISGGELTEASMDDSIRHSITKLSHFHFVANDIYKKRVIQLGENPNQIFITGGTGIDNIKNLNFYSKNQLEKILCFKFKKYNFILTYLPVTYLNNQTSHKKEINTIISALASFKDCNIFITYPNLDEGSREIIKEIKNFKKNNKNIKVFKTLGKARYLSILKHFDCLIGNSSSGITEAPYLGIPTINIGDRQKGRLKSKSIVDCNPNRMEIIKKVKKILNKKFRHKIQNQKTYYGSGNSSKKIVNIIRRISLKHILNEKFYNIK